MIERFIFGMHWKHDGKMYYDEVPADSKEEAALYFIDHKQTMFHWFALCWLARMKAAFESFARRSQIRLRLIVHWLRVAGWTRHEDV